VYIVGCLTSGQHGITLAAVSVELPTNIGMGIQRCDLGSQLLPACPSICWWRNSGLFSKLSGKPGNQFRPFVRRKPAGAGEDLVKSQGSHEPIPFK
jgi:hypothetical protein